MSDTSDNQATGPHELFDAEWYLQQNPDVAAAGIDPFEHYMTHGWREGRDPHPLFDTSFYLENNPDVAESGENPLVHFIFSGWREERNPHPLFDISFYLNSAEPDFPLNINPLIHYCIHGWREGRDPHRHFSTSWYLTQNQDVISAKVNPLIHYIKYGAIETRDPSPDFSNAWYRSHNHDVAAAGINPLIHYVLFGEKEGRTPNSNTLDIWSNRKAQICEDVMCRLQPGRGIIDVTGPLISIIVPVYNTPIKYLDRMIESVLNQTYSNWQLCLADDASPEPEVSLRLEQYKARDSRISLHFSEKNGGISAASNAALNLADGSYIALLDHDDVLTNDALFWVAEEIKRYPDVEWMYSDECKLTDQDVAIEPFLKPDWSPTLLFNCMYTGHLSVYRKDVVLSLGGFRSEFDFSQDYDLALRIAEVATIIRHIPKILYGWRMASGSGAAGEKPYARESNISALQDAARRRGIPATAVPLPTANRLIVHNSEITENVSIIIPSDSLDNINESIRTIESLSTYRDLEILVVTNSEIVDQLSKEHYSVDVLFVRYDKPFNFCDKCNEGAKHASGEVLVFYNDDVRVLSEDWLQSILECFRFGKIGIVGPKLLYENDSIQHAGMVTGVRQFVGTAFHALPSHYLSVGNLAQSVREVSLICGACLAIPKIIFDLVGGFDAVNVPIGHSDVDLCFRVRQLGYSCLYTPHASLRHIGHMSIGSAVPNKNSRKEKIDIYLLKNYLGYVAYDPYFPTTLRGIEYRDSPEYFEVSGQPAKSRTRGKDILIASHDLSWSGAPRVIYDIAKILKEAGHFVVVAAPAYGPYKERLNEAGITTIVDELLFARHDSIYNLAKQFDVLISNTIVSWPIVQQLMDNVDTFWYLHELELIPALCEGNSDVASTIRDCKNIWACSDRVASVVSQCGGSARVLEFGLDPIAKDAALQSPRGKISLLLLGSYEPRKGQDIAIEAVLRLPEEIRRRVRLEIYGRILDHNFFSKTQELIVQDLPVFYGGEITPEEAAIKTLNSDIILVPSRSDAFPLTALDGLRAGKIVIMSRDTGTADYIDAGKNGFVSSETNAESFAEAIAQAISMQRNWSVIGRNAQNLFTAGGHLSIESFKNRLLNGLDCH